jgi:tripartite-type tricarboxylate transporter receptor subunit TctC
MEWLQFRLAHFARCPVAVLQIAILLTVISNFFATEAFAQSYPSRPIKIIVPSTAGSPNDAMARLLADHMSQRLGQPIVIDNKPGAGTVIGTRAVVAADPDGYTFLFTSSAVVIDPAMKTLDYDPLKDLVPVATVNTAAWLITISPSLPVNLAEFVAYTMAHPGTTNFGSTQGTAAILVAELFKQLSGADLFIVPYKGGQAAMPDFLGGRIQVMDPTPATALSLIRSGKMLPLLITSANRSPELPDVPTAREVGLPDMTLEFWSGMLAPAGTPAAIVNKVNATINDILQTLEMKKVMGSLGFDAKIGSPQDFAAFMSQEKVRWGEIVKKTGVRFD